ncbi:MAG: hypothetical protein JNL90_19025 [Planctomycetes bacterium]|nr:hypothetical protein [Planctomycetota bacterium]
MPHARRSAALALALGSVLATAGCTTVVAPPPAQLVEPCEVILLRGAAHLALVLPDGQGGAVRYGFGDRAYMSDFSWTQYPWAALLALIGPFGEWTPGALERIDGPGESVAQLAQKSTLEAQRFVVERARAVALAERLAGKCGAPLAECWWLRATDDRYSLWWDNCQSAVAGWCRELGCEVSPWRLAPRWASFEVALPEDAAR